MWGWYDQSLKVCLDDFTWLGAHENGSDLLCRTQHCWHAACSCLRRLFHLLRLINSMLTAIITLEWDFQREISICLSGVKFQTVISQGLRNVMCLYFLQVWLSEYQEQILVSTVSHKVIVSKKIQILKICRNVNTAEKWKDTIISPDIELACFIHFTFSSITVDFLQTFNLFFYFLVWRQELNYNCAPVSHLWSTSQRKKIKSTTNQGKHVIVLAPRNLISTVRNIDINFRESHRKPAYNYCLVWRRKKRVPMAWCHARTRRFLSCVYLSSWNV